MIKVLFVCLGNICRSPLAEAIFKQLVVEQKLQHHIQAHSCGTATWHIGDPPDSRTLANAKQNGVVIDHLGRRLNEEDLQEYDYLVAMDEDNLGYMERLQEINGGKAKLMLMRQYDPSKDANGVPDPYYGGPNGFQEVFDILMRSNKQFIQFLVETHRLNHA